MQDRISFGELRLHRESSADAGRHGSFVHSRGCSGRCYRAGLPHHLTPWLCAACPTSAALSPASSPFAAASWPTASHYNDDDRRTGSAPAPAAPAAPATQCAAQSAAPASTIPAAAAIATTAATCSATYSTTCTCATSAAGECRIFTSRECHHDCCHWRCDRNDAKLLCIPCVSVRAEQWSRQQQGRDISGVSECSEASSVIAGKAEEAAAAGRRAQAKSKPNAAQAK